MADEESVPKYILYSPQNPIFLRKNHYKADFYFLLDINVQKS